jgi:iron(III) transport system substrate-binding protein
MRKSILTLALSLAALLAGCSKPHERLVVYTAAEADQIQPYADSFKKARPDIDLVWVRDSTGVVTAKLLAEQKAPQADVVFALAATSMMKLDDAGLLAPYAPKGLESVDARFRDGRPVPHWTGEALWSACPRPRAGKT